MEIYATWQTMGSAVILSLVAAQFLFGGSLIRCIAWIWLWCALTPIRPVAVDVPLMLIGFAASELIYLKVARKP